MNTARARGLAGFTLIELMIVLAIIATLSSMGFVRYRRVVAAAEEVVAEKELRDIFDAITLFQQTHGRYPDSLDELGLGPLLDPWGNPYQYLNFSPSEPEDDAHGAPADAGGGAGAGGGKGKGASGSGGGSSGGGAGSSSGGGAAPVTQGEMRKDRFLVPINTWFDLYSMGPDGKSAAPLTAAASRDDVIVANDGDFIGLASLY